jgi:hypothetical protein
MGSKCEHKWVDMEDDTLDKFCVRCSKKCRQAVMAIPLSLEQGGFVPQPPSKQMIDDLYKSMGVPSHMLLGRGRGI